MRTHQEFIRNMPYSQCLAISHNSYYLCILIPKFFGRATGMTKETHIAWLSQIKMELKGCADVLNAIKHSGDVTGSINAIAVESATNGSWDSIRPFRHTQRIVDDTDRPLSISEIESILLGSLDDIEKEFKHGGRKGR